MIGSSLGAYEIREPLGAGGMGEVYLAHDPRLGRDVAIKLLPAELSADRDRLGRFEREARLLAQLEHPNIAAVYGLERAGETTFLVMQLVSGQTLADRIAAGPLVADDAIAIARQIAEGMEAAHERGIIHRDLKPANVMVADDGGVKILDFGLAKALASDGDPRSSNPEMSASPTMLAGTIAGVILGTAAYMSPEQARGRPLDRRTDIWAFGCLLFEMLVGQPAFGGGTVTDVLAAIVKEEPDWSALPPSTPAWLRALIGRCMDKEARSRLRDIGEARVALEQGGDGAAVERVIAPAGPRSRAMIAALIVLPLLATALTWALTRPEPQPAPLLRGAIALPDEMLLNIEGDNAGPPALSPDGTRLVFSASTPADGLKLWVRRMDSLRSEPLAGTDGGYFPFWSPDGRSVAYFVQDKLMRIDLQTGQTQTITGGIELGRDGAWHPDGTIYYAPITTSGILAVHESGRGDPVPLGMDETRYTTQRWARLLPDNEHLVFFTANHADGAGTGAISIARRDGSDMRELLRASSGAIYGAEHLLFVREGALMAQRLDLSTLELVGDPVPLGESVAVDATTWRAAMTAADNGTLVYLPAGQPLGRILRWVDRAGETLDTWQPSGNYQTVRLSPDDSLLAVEFQEEPVSELYVYSADGRREQISFDEGDDSEPVWSEDGKTLYDSHWDQVTYSLQAIPAVGGTARPVLKLEDRHVWPNDLSREAGILIAAAGNFYQRTSDATRLLAIPLDGSDWYPLFGDGEWKVTEASVSHDGRSLAFTSRVRESADLQIYVAPLERVDGRITVGEPRRQVSRDGGYQPRWRGDDAELYFVQGAGLVRATTLTRGARGELLRSEQPVTLFSAILGRGPGLGYSYDVTEDGQRFVILETDRRARQLAVVSDWRRALEPARR